MISQLVSIARATSGKLPAKFIQSTAYVGKFYLNGIEYRIHYVTVGDVIRSSYIHIVQDCRITVYPGELSDFLTLPHIINILFI